MEKNARRRTPVRAAIFFLAVVIATTMATSSHAGCDSEAPPAPGGAILAALSPTTSVLQAREIVLEPRLATGPYLDALTAAEFRDRYVDWYKGRGAPPRLTIDPNMAPLLPNGAHDLAAYFEAQLDGVMTPDLRAHIRNFAIPGMTPRLVTGLDPQALGPAATYNIFARGPEIQRTVGSDDPARAENFRRAPPPPMPYPGTPVAPQPGVASAAPIVWYSEGGSSDRPVPASAYNLLDALVTIDIEGSKPCNGVHIGAGRFLTNLHCAYTAARRRVLFGAPFYNAKGEPRAVLRCDAQVVWPRTPTIAARRLDIAVLELTGAPPEFARSRYANVAVALAAGDAWADQKTPLISLQVRREVASGRESLIRRFENGIWSGSQCLAKRPDGQHRDATPCTISSLDPVAPHVSDVGEQHGCDASISSSGMPLLVMRQDGEVALAGLHRVGAGKDGSNGPKYHNVNCAVSAEQIAQSLGADAFEKWAAHRR